MPLEIFKPEELEWEQVLELCSVSTKMMAKTFFPHLFYAPFSSAIHDPIIQRLDGSSQRVAIAAPRGTGKTSLVSIPLAARKILFRQCNFIVYVSKSFDNAQLQTENLKMELMANKEIKEVFGSIKVRDKVVGLDEQFSKKAWASPWGTLVLPRGAGQQIRGLLYRGKRPDLFIIDDLEDDHEIENDDLRKKLKVWFHSNLEKAVSRLDQNWKIVYIDTLKHEDALLQELLDAPEWDSVRLEMFDDNLKSTAPEFMSDAEVKKEYEYHKREGMLDVLYREFRNLPIAKEDAVFREEYFKYYSEADLQGRAIENVIIVDPAKTKKFNSAETAIVCWGIDLETRALYFRDCVNGKMLPDEMYDELFLMAQRFKTRVAGIEVTSLNEFIVQPIKNEMSARGFMFELIELKARGGGSYNSNGYDKGKDRRIASLLPYYRQGYIYHNPQCCVALESQLLSFPRSKLKDVSDAAAYIVEMMELGDRYFMPVDQWEDPEDEFEGLEADPVMEDWRIV